MITVLGMEQPPLDHLGPWRDTLMDLPALVTAAEALLMRLPRSEDERISALPDERTVRYYQTLGLVDRPARYEGRSARYQLRHLLQIICVKLLQAQGLGLGQVQAALSGATDPQLEAAVMEALGAPKPAPAPPRALMAFQLAPGAILTLDPTLFPDPLLIATQLSQSLTTLKTPGGRS